MDKHIHNYSNRNQYKYVAKKSAFSDINENENNAVIATVDGLCTKKYIQFWLTIPSFLDSKIMKVYTMFRHKVQESNFGRKSYGDCAKNG